MALRFSPSCPQSRPSCCEQKYLKQKSTIDIHHNIHHLRKYCLYLSGWLLYQLAGRLKKIWANFPEIFGRERVSLLQETTGRKASLSTTFTLQHAETKDA